MRTRTIRTVTRNLERKLSKMERGQVIVLIALALVGLLAATGLAIDGGLIVTRRADLQRAVDAAALGGVVELVNGTQADADVKAQDLLAANGMDILDSNVEDIDDNVPCPDDAFCLRTDQPSSPQLGSFRYRVQASMPVPLTFMNVIGISQARVQAEAVAEHFPQAELFASQTLETGLIKSSLQAVWGPDGCTYNGDPYTPSQSPWWDELEGTYHYRLRVPRSFVDNYSTLRVEIFDPDSYNQPNSGSVVITHEDGSTDTVSVSGNRANPVLIDLSGYPESPNNDWWFYRVEEMRNGVPGTNTNCNVSSYDPESSIGEQYETGIQFELFYYRTEADGSLTRQNLASYTSPQSDVDPPPAWHPNVDQHCTDLRWVSPGPLANQGSDFPGGTCPRGVPVDGSGDTPYAYTPDIGNGDFEIDMPTIDYNNRTCSGTEMDNCYIDPLSDDIYIFLDVSGVTGASENIFEFWAGPDLSVYDIPTNVNERHLYILDPVNGGPVAAHGSQGVVVAGLGHLPYNAVGTQSVDIPLMYVGPELAGQTFQIRLFDPDAGSQGPITFFFDTIPQSDWSYITCDDGAPYPPEGANPPGTPPCDQPPGNQNADQWQQIEDQNMQDRWIDPPFEFVVPSESDPTPIVFVGGILNAHYGADHMDTYGWFITIESRPYLIE